MTPDYKRQLTLLFLVAAVVLAAGLGLRDPWPADEPRFALIAREMVESGNWLLPHIGGVLYPDKPPLFFWLVAALYTFTGSIQLSLLLPGLLAGLGTLYLVTDLGRRLWGPGTAIWCGATLLALMQFPLQMKSGQIDGLLCFLTTLSLYGLSRHLLLGPDWRWYTVGGIAAGLGVITKGVGFLPYLVFVPYLLAGRNGWGVFRHSWRDLRWLLAPAATLFVIGIWLLPMLMVTNGGTDPELLAYRDNILFHQTVTRYANSWGHIKPPWYLFTNAVPLLWLPVSLLLPWLVVQWRRDLKNRNAAILLFGSWILLVLIFFSFSAGKRSLYIFPAAPALALIAGFHARQLVRRAGVRRMLLLAPALISIIFIVGGTHALMNPTDVSQWFTDIPTLVKTFASVVLIGMVMLAIVALSLNGRAIPGFAVAMIAFWTGLGLLVAPAIDSNRSGRALIASVEQQIAANEELAFVAWPEQFLLQWNRPLTHFGFRRDPAEDVGDAVLWLAASDDRRVLLPEYVIDPCFDSARMIPVGRAHRRDWLIADKSAVSESCIAPGDENPVVVVKYSRPGQQAPDRIIHTASINSLPMSD